MLLEGFYIVYNGFKILVTEEMKPETGKNRLIAQKHKNLNKFF